MTIKIDMTGREFGRLKVLHISNRKTNEGRPMWLCQCSCGNTKEICGKSLRQNRTRSCGCLISETASARTPALHAAITKHGLCNPNDRKKYLTWACWRNMIRRCSNPSDHSYDRYGGRGIRVCDRWTENVENFIEDMGLRPFPGAQIDRIDNNGDYSPENCRWSTCSQNCRNKSNNRTVEFEGKRVTIAELSDICGIPPGALLKRIFDSNWPLKKAMTYPLRKRRT